MSRKQIIPGILLLLIFSLFIAWKSEATAEKNTVALHTKTKSARP